MRSWSGPRTCSNGCDSVPTGQSGPGRAPNDVLCRLHHETSLSVRYLPPVTEDAKQMIGDLFDSPWKILIVAVVILVLFGSRKLPDAARSLGRSMRILKTEVQGMHEDEAAAPAAAQSTPPAAQAQLEAATPAPDAQAKIAALQEQISTLQQSAAANGTPAADTKQTR